MKKIYQVAGHCFAVEADGNILEKMTQYQPFEVEKAGGSGLVYSLSVVKDESFPDVEISIDTTQDDDGSQIEAGHTNDGRSYFEFLLFGRRSGRMLVRGTNEATIWLESNWQFGLNNGMMVMYALATACQKTALFHSSVVSYEEHGYMFLGKSGTGKSTHSSLWLKYIEGTELMNDDNPVVRIHDDGSIWVYGSPWSGKTPCYRNVNYPIGAIVLLSQAPYNKIQRMGGIHAYASLMESISGKRWDSRIADGLHQTQNSLVMSVPMWHLECLPDEEAAQTCFSTIRSDDNRR
jgi:hypothetical protein